MSTRRFSPIPAWLRRRGFSPRVKHVIASAVERTALRRGAPEPESRCQIIPFPVRPLPVRTDGVGDSRILQVGV